jgi:hypothetical protein
MDIRLLRGKKQCGKLFGHDLVRNYEVNRTTGVFIKQNI